MHYLASYQHALGHRYYSGTWKWVKPLIWAEGPPIGLYRTAVVHLVRSLCVGNQVVVYVSRKRTLYLSR